MFRRGATGYTGGIMRLVVFSILAVSVLAGCGAKTFTVDSRSPSRVASAAAPEQLKALKLALAPEVRVTGEAAKSAGASPAVLRTAVEEQLAKSGYVLVPPGGEDVHAVLHVDYSETSMNVFSGSADDGVRVRLTLAFDLGGQPVAETVNDDGLVLVPGEDELPARSLAASVVNSIPDSHLLQVLK